MTRSGRASSPGTERRRASAYDDLRRFVADLALDSESTTAVFGALMGGGVVKPEDLRALAPGARASERFNGRIHCR